MKLTATDRSRSPRFGLRPHRGTRVSARRQLMPQPLCRRPGEPGGDSSNDRSVHHRRLFALANFRSSGGARPATHECGLVVAGRHRGVGGRTGVYGRRLLAIGGPATERACPVSFERRLVATGAIFGPGAGRLSVIRARHNNPLQPTAGKRAQSAAPAERRHRPRWNEGRRLNGRPLCRPCNARTLSDALTSRRSR